MIAFTGTARLLAGSISTLNKWEEEEEEEDGTNTQIKVIYKKKESLGFGYFWKFLFLPFTLFDFLNYSSFKMLN